MSRYFLSCLAGLVISVSAVAGEREIKQVKAELVRAFPEFAEAAVRPAPVAGLYEIELDAKILYVTGDGKFLFAGDLMDLGARTNVTESRRAAIRARLLDEVGDENMIVMGPARPKRTLTVFTDVDCPYCAKFHLDAPALNKEGVRVRYLFFPRTGLNSESYKRSVAVWCAADRVKAIGIAKAGGKLDMKTCANPVEKHYRLGERLEIGGTPAIFLDNGRMLPGYIPAPRLLAMLGLRNEAPGGAAR